MSKTVQLEFVNCLIDNIGDYNLDVVFGKCIENDWMEEFKLLYTRTIKNESHIEIIIDLLNDDNIKRRPFLLHIIENIDPYIKQCVADEMFADSEDIFSSMKKLHQYNLLHQEVAYDMIADYCPHNLCVKCLKFMLDHNYLPTKENIIFFVEQGSIACINYLRIRNYELTNEMSYIAATCSQLKMLQYLYKHNCPIDIEKLLKTDTLYKPCKKFIQQIKEN